MDMLREAAETLRDYQQEFASRLIEFRRDADGLEILATVGRTLFERFDATGVPVTTESADWIVDPAPLIAVGLWPPRRGDLIVDVEGDDPPRIYNVAAPTPDDVWRWCDRHRMQARIHSSLAGGAS